MAKLQEGPTRIRFYQLAGFSLEEATRRIAEKAWQRGLRVCLVTGDDRWEGYLDDYLWQGPATGFLPHGRCRDPHPHRQPILLCPQPEDVNGASVIVVTCGLLLEQPDRFDMVIDFVQTAPEEFLQASRFRYKQYRDVGYAMEYWTQSSTGWQQQG